MGIFKSASVYKILLPLVILVVLAVVFYVVVLHRETQSPDSEKISAIIQSATFTPPGTDVKATLTGGQAYFTYEDTESFALVQHILGIHETNSGTDVFAEVAVNTGGSGVFV